MECSNLKNLQTFKLLLQIGSIQNILMIEMRFNLLSLSTLEVSDLSWGWWWGIINVFTQIWPLVISVWRWRWRSLLRQQNEDEEIRAQKGASLVSCQSYTSQVLQTMTKYSGIHNFDPKSILLPEYRVSTLKKNRGFQNLKFKPLGFETDPYFSN